MKRILFYAALLSCSFLGCKKAEKASQEGVYQLEKQVISGGGKDSAYERTQIKIYIPHHFMYAGMTPDSAIGYGVGTYTLDTGNRIIEHRFYTSSTLDTGRTFKMKITPKDNGYKQIIPAMAIIKGVKYDLKEDYTKLPGGDSSKLDGLWKMNKAYLVKGKDTVNLRSTQYKIFWRGYFIFLHRYPLDKEETKFKYGFGYGPFTFKNNMLSEQEQITNFADLLNQKFNVKIAFKDNNEYTQIITDPKTNQQSVEIYSRVE
jgi:hypothetical protein